MLITICPFYLYTHLMTCKVINEYRNIFLVFRYAINTKESLVCNQGKNKEYLSIVYVIWLDRLPTKKKSPVSQRLKAARLESGLSQKALGIKSGIDEFSASARMNQYETDKHVPDYLTLKRIAKVLKLPTAYFYCESDDLADVVKGWAKK